jgi:hypothetical protein
MQRIRRSRRLYYLLPTKVCVCVCVRVCAYVCVRVCACARV